MYLRSFALDRRGNISLIFAIAAIALILSAGLAIDYGNMVSKQSSLQAAADAASIAAARELSLANAEDEQIAAVAERMVSVRQDATAGNAQASSVEVRVAIDNDASRVEVELVDTWKPYFAGMFGKSAMQITVAATAQVIGSGKICVVGLEDTQNRTIHLRRKATLTANGCGVYSNSTDSSSIRIDDDGTLAASLICSAGGAYGISSSYNPSPTTDCPVLPDPLSARIPPPVGFCDFNDFETEEPMTLSPGVYCGGLVVADTEVMFRPGIYIIKDGPLEASGSASLQGEHVGFYFTGGDAGILFGSKSRISLTAPTDGDMAGLLFFEDRNNLSGFSHRITSNDARLLLGTIYLSRGTLFVDANAPVADQSAYTAIIARKLVLDAGPNLVLNYDYGATDIPVSNALSGVGGRIVLAK